MPGFDEFWNAYPNKVGKPKALALWNRFKPDLDAVTAGPKRWKASDQRTKDGGHYIPHPTIWLNREGWNDAISGEKPEASVADLKASQERIDALRQHNQEWERHMVEDQCRQLGVTV